MDSRQILEVSNDLDVGRATSSRPQRDDARQDLVDAQRLAHQLSRSREHEQITDDFCRAIGFAIDHPHVPLQRACSAAFPRSSSRCPSTPCRGLFNSCAMPATSCPRAASFSTASTGYGAARARLQAVRAG